MAAVNPNGNELYWVDGHSYDGVVKNNLIIGNELFWVDGYSEQNLVPLQGIFTGATFLIFE